MSKKLVIIGASGHGKVVADIGRKMNRYEEIVFLDDAPDLTECMGCRIVGKSSEYKKYDKSADFFVAIGNADIRKKFIKQLVDEGVEIATLCHPDAVVAERVRIGKGSVIMAGVVINPDVEIGVGCIVNTCASIDHECRVLDYVHISVGAHVAGAVTVGSESWIGIGAVVSNNVEIVHNCIVGAGAVVISDLKEPGIYIGVPARRKCKED